MQFFKKLLDFYINASIHVALSVYALVQLTQILFTITTDFTTPYFAFFGTIVGYNFVKYDALARAKRLKMTLQLKAIAFLSFLSLIATGYYFLQLQKSTQIIGFVFLAITLLYTLPFFPNKKNARNWAGIKIYIVALCWVGVTLFLPIINADLPFSSYVFLVAAQRFILIFVMVLIFEIIDLKWDDPHLKTVPQQIGVQKTKRVGIILMFLFVLLEFLSTDFRIEFLALKLALAITTIVFLLFSNEHRSRYYASFWVESIPIFWWLFLVLFG
ncbi:hypothetical protein [Flavobacterium aquatile]|uniref:Prenyltransferase n=1 Tax=Flavobacterium aquatile LMG 4008 = ATCC 11947 TaxID=1453498 RepID=A0A095STW0_9FLAO|nr:hypothetical protein [Flavobacterium aquatile]KGD68027.1 hypothetical protein LG45_06940 [Flavobacterium aquatile LMG 4008 = ATCC 11947]OXA68204.1 hypothetical protein B0A61_04845 [Flavobacterium aquatile LMG 4008 = ATCC 11947]GEC79893.1 hypothetical protein FAQ01_27630 [Flavobacterium aquatile]